MKLSVKEEIKSFVSVMMFLSAFFGLMIFSIWSWEYKEEYKTEKIVDVIEYKYGMREGQRTARIAVTESGKYRLLLFDDKREMSLMVGREYEFIIRRYNTHIFSYPEIIGVVNNNKIMVEKE